MSKENEDAPVTVEEIQSLKEEIILMHKSLAKDVIEHAPVVKKIVELFVEKGLNQQWIERLLAPLVGSNLESDEVLLLAYVLEEIDSLISIKDEEINLKQKIHIFVGGTGIGKTSFVGKLGARYRYLLKKSYDVAFINFDREKVGAVEQLRHYSDAMEIPLIEVDELLNNQYDLVCIDTSGNMGKNTSDLFELIELIKESTDYEIELSLVIAATTKERDMERIFNSFSSFKIESFILTKLDETNDLSDALNFLINHNTIPLSYLSIGQEIPEDLMVASKEYLLNQFMKEENNE